MTERIDPATLCNRIPACNFRDVDEQTISAVHEHVKACKLRASKVSPVDFLHVLDDVEALGAPNPKPFHWSVGIYTDEGCQVARQPLVNLSVLDMPTRITDTTVVFQRDHFLVVRADESVPAEFWIARVRKDITWSNRKNNIPVIWYISTSKDENVNGRFIACERDGEPFFDHIELETIIHCFPALQEGTEGKIPSSTLHIIKDRILCFDF